MVLRGAMGRSGRKRARRATKYITGNGGFLTASTVLAAAGVAWGIYDSVKGQNVPQVPNAPGVPHVPMGATVPGAMGAAVPPIPVLPTELPSPVLQLIRLAVSASRADGELTAVEREEILARAKAAGLAAIVEPELAQTSRPLSEIVQGVTDPAARKEFYTLAFTIVRADEVVTGAERIYLAQLAHRLGLDPSAVAAIEAETTAKIDAQADTE
ncbi:MAG: DUF533 domain-containing protein [Acidobacteriota bacterium]|nr:DUF533 domain-containing protein [Acidobacteriota bacterium]